jgi:hypothetical protein
MESGNQQLLAHQVPQGNAPLMYNSPPQQTTMIIQTMPQEEIPAGSSECRSKYPEQFYCTTCRRNLVSRIEASWGVGSCCWFLFCSPSIVLAFLPCCVDCLRDVKHTCPLCQTTVGKYTCCCC